MWDSSWLRRRHRGGGFEDWDKALAELVDRGYNAVRLDVFPHLIAPSPTGEIVEVFKDVPNQYPQFYGFGMWGNPWTHYIRPREALVEFMGKCRDHGVKVGLSTWFKPTDDRRNEQIEGLDEFVRVWNQTLEFIDDHGLMDTVIYLDVLNEYPQGNCFHWMHKMLATMTQPAPPTDRPGRLNEKQTAFFWTFMNDAIDALRKNWPTLSMATSFTYKHLQGPCWGVDLSNMDFLDVHVWITQNPEYSQGTRYGETVGKHGNPHYLWTTEHTGGYGPTSQKLIPQDYHYDEVYEAMLTKWRDRKAEWTQWYTDVIDWIVSQARTYNVPHLGQTEGWGPVNWTEHPLLEWDIHREAAEICATLCAERGYLFNCSANFCHPHFLGFWENPAWHRRLTETIRSARLG
jgi:hypothetical protein